MRIKFSVNQAACLEAGIDAPTSTVTLDIDPAQYTPQERALLAEAAPNGWEATQKVWATSRTYNFASLYLKRPDEQGLRDVLKAILDARARVEQAEQAEQEAQRAEARAWWDQERGKLAAGPVTAKISASLAHDGTLRSDAYGSPQIQGREVQVPYCPDTLRFSDSVPDDIRAARDAHAAALAAAREALLPELRQLKAAEQAERAAQQADYDALYARLPETMRQRHAAGYADADEIKGAIASLMRADANYGPHKGFGASHEASTLTDDAFLQLRAAERSAPPGAEVEPRCVYDTTELPCDDHDEYDEDCDNCEREHSNRRIVARITWTRGGVEARAYLLLSQQDAPENGKPWAELATDYERRTRG